MKLNMGVSQAGPRLDPTRHRHEKSTARYEHEVVDNFFWKKTRQGTTRLDTTRQSKLNLVKLGLGATVSPDMKARGVGPYFKLFNLARHKGKWVWIGSDPFRPMTRAGPTHDHL